MPADRWTPEETTRTTDLLGETDFPGYYLDDVDSFDSDYFVIPPREAATMDPQQRLALELSCEALQEAGIDPRSLAGTNAGVYFGVGAFDFGQRCLNSLETISPWSGIGSSYCGVANRLSYVLDLRGPSVAIDTACSASMVAIHSACQALRSGEIDLAIVGGVNVIGAPGFTVALAAAGATSPTGSSRPFDQAADGYVRGEGGGVLVLQTLADAQRRGNRVAATIRASAVGQEGRTNGIMAPDAAAQSALIRRTYTTFGLDPSTISYVEAHGTGTPVGDPEEAEALSEVFGRQRLEGQPCWIGSIKANVGHLEAGSGVISVIKAAHIVNRGYIPGQANFDAPSEGINWAANGLAVATSTTPLPQMATPHRAGISGYGYGGTISHIVVEAPPGGAGAIAQDRPSRSFHVPVSGRSVAHLQSWASRLGAHLSHTTDVALADIAHTLTCRTEHQRYRTTVRATSTTDFADRLQNFATSADPVIVDSDSHGTPQPGPVFVFSGHGSQWADMASDLFAMPAFASVIDAIDTVYAEELGTRCRDLLLHDDFTTAQSTQAAIFAVQCGIAALWRSFGVIPAAIIGQSIGEIAASVEAGAMSLSDGARLACRKAVLVSRADGNGAMLLVDADEETVAPYLRGRDLAVAIITAHDSLVIAGGQQDIERTGKQLNDAGIGVRRVASGVAFHSSHMDPLVEPLRVSARLLGASTPTVTLYTTALSDPRDQRLRDADYWCANLRNPVNLVGAVTAALDDSYRTFIEISPHPLVVHALREIADDAGHETVIAHSLRRGRPSLEELESNLAAMFCSGVPVDWRALDHGTHVSLPPRPWIRRSMPRISEATHVTRGAQARTLTVTPDTMLGAVRTVGNRSGDLIIAEAEVDYDTRPYPGIHAINGVEIVPASVLVGSFLPLAGQGHGHRLADVRFVSAITLSNQRRRYTVTREGCCATLASVDPATDERVIHATVDYPTGSPTALAATIDTQPVFARCTTPRTLEELRGLLKTRGVVSDTYRWSLESLYTSGDELIARVETGHHGTWAAALDGCFTLPVLLFEDTDDMRMVVAVETVELEGQPPERMIIHARRRLGLTDGVDITILDSEEAVCGHLGNAQFVPAYIASDIDVSADLSYLSEEWRAERLDNSAPSLRATFYVLADEHLPEVLRRLPACAGRVHYAPHADALLDGSLPADSVVLIPSPSTTENRCGALDAQLIAKTLIELGDLDFRPRIWLLSQHSSAMLPTAAKARGVGRVLAGEYPDLFSGSISIPAKPTDADIAALIARTASPAENADVIIEHGDVLEWGLFPVAGASVQRDAAEIYILTDVSRVTVDIAAELASRGAHRIVFLTTETAAITASPGFEELVAELAEHPTDVRQVLIGEEFDATELRAAIAHHVDSDRRSAVIHPMGILRRQNGPDSRPTTVAAGDTRLLATLHEAFPPDGVHLFVTLHGLEHIAGLRGCAEGAGAAAVASAMMNARSESAAPSRSISIAWASPPQYVDDAVRTAYTTELELRHWHPTPVSNLCSLMEALPAAARRGSVVAVTTADTAPAATEPQPESAGPVEGSIDIESRVRQCISRETTLSLDELAQYTSLRDIGADSVLLLSIRRALERTFKTKLPAKLLWDTPSIPALSDHIQNLAAAGRG